MGQEYAETAPFLYFVSHSDQGLIDAVRQGRRREFAAFAWRGEVPDAQDEATFRRSKLNSALRETGRHAVLLRWYKELLRLRRELPALASPNRQLSAVDVHGSGRTIVLRRWSHDEEVIGAFHFGSEAANVNIRVAQPVWRKLLDSAEDTWLGDGTAIGSTLYPVSGELQLALTGKQCVVLAGAAATRETK
jgi:maltooligosyltrehalose trehalohydrolase